MNHLLSEITLCAFDIESSGAHPLESEICELAAVKWKNGQIIDRFQTLIKPTHLMSDFIISIHGITNEMVKDAPRIENKISEFYEFIKGCYGVGHHSPFDMGFIAIEFEKQKLLPPTIPVFCSSLIARKVFPESVNHKLQTLVKFLNLESNTAHRALDDAISCLNVTLKCIEKLGWDKTVADLQKTQGRKLEWIHFYIQEIVKDPRWSELVRAIREKKDARIVIKFQRSNKNEKIKPLGLVRNPDGDFIFAHSYEEKRVKRYYIDKISESEVIEEAQTQLF